MDSDSKVSYFARISLAYQDISGLLIQWSNDCSQFAVYEHPKDDGPERTHVHIIAIGSSVVADSIKARFKLKGHYLKGNKDWTFKEYDESRNPFAYCSKGKYHPKIVKGFDEDFIEMQRQKYVPPPPKVELSSDAKPSSDLEELWLMLEDKYKGDLSLCDWSITDVMRWSCGIYFRKKGRFPRAGHFKSDISTLYVRLKELQIQDGYIDVHGDYFGNALDYLGFFPKN